ncbi:hypothetical protein DC31_02065 [Microbacterium sp. CH12i]|uniref:sensor histidine kinase n=1 Tax=Microbacterium sp. CH12i TaxID=1479651 RepID=UPI0004615B50|nr:HAMP domain-containing sensor histidine kinase [Microbacterium sp. CH12i]KDA04900.1 hypothetical protein DC31_02065 [Microbacterium sp. CH12i]
MWKAAQPARISAPSAIRYFGDSRCRSIWQWQLILAFTTVAVAAGIALLTPQLLADWRVSAGILTIIVASVICLAVPWHKVGPGAVLVLPVVDALAIGLLDLATNPPISFLWVFPVAWVASYYSTTVLVSMMTLIAGLALFRVFDLGLTPREMIRMMVLLVTLGFVGVIMSVGSERSRSTRRLLQAQSGRIANALRRVTEQKTRNQRLIDSLDIGIAQVSAGGAIEVSNRAFHALYALGSSAQFRPTSAVEYQSRRGQPIALTNTTIARASRGELFTDELVWLFGLDGEWRALRTSTLQIDDSARTKDAVLLLVEDVSTKVDARAGEQATRRNLSHELRNPLTAILGHVDLLLEHDEFSESMRRQLQVVERAGERMQRLIDDALSTASHPGEDADLDFDLADLTRSSIEGFTPVAGTDGVTLKVRLDEALPLCGDAFRLRQVVDNVIGNAIKYAQRGGTVTIRSARRDDAMTLVVTDTGIGISEEDLPHVFEPEFRTQLAREQGIPGTGLGLGIARDIVLDQGGRLEIASELGQGTAVTLVLPTRQDRRLT